MATNPNQPSFTNTFQGGMNKDSNVLLQPEGTYREARNFQLVNHDGNNFTLKDALGNRMVITIPPGYTDESPLTEDAIGMPIGFISFPDKLIVFSTNNSSSTGGYGEIGQIYLTNIGESVEGADVILPYGNTAYTFNGYVPLYRHDSLNFSQMYKIEGFGFKENDAIERVYWTDNYNQPRVFDIADSTFSTYFTTTAGPGDNPLVSGDEYMVLNGIIQHPVGIGPFYGPGMPLGNIFTASANTFTAIAGYPTPLVIKYFDYNLLDFTPPRSLGNIYFSDFGSGTKKCGNHMYFYRLLKGTSGFKTSWSYSSFPVHVGKDQATISGDDPSVAPTLNSSHNYVGAGTLTSLETSTKSVKLKITDIDLTYDTIELACVEYDQDYEVPYAMTIVATKGYTSTTLNSDGSIDVEDFGNVNLGTLTLDDLTLAPANILRCKSLTTNKNYILAGNITERLEFDTLDFSDATFSDFIYHMPVDRQIDYCSVPNVPSFPMTSACPFTPGVNPGAIYPKVKYFVLSGGTITYNAVPYGIGDVFEGINGVPAWVVVTGTPLIRPCFAWEKYNPINNTSQRKNIIEAKVVTGGGNTELNYRNPAAAMHLKSYRSSEKYRFGILFYDKRGNPFYVRWLIDYTFTDIYTKNGLLHDVGVGDVYSSVYSLTPNGFQIDDLRIPYEVYTNISGFSIVRAECDKTIDAQGLLWQTCYSNSWGTSTEIRPIPGMQLGNISSTSSAGPLNGEYAYSFMCPDSLVSYRGFQKGFTAGDKIRVAGWLHPVEFVGSGKYHAWYDPTFTGANSDQTWSKLYTHVDATNYPTVNEQTIIKIEGMNEGDTVVNLIPGYDFYNANLWFGVNGSLASEPVYNGWLGGGSADWRHGRMVGGRKIAVTFGGDFNNYNVTATYNQYSVANTGLYHKALVNYIIDKPNQYGGTGDDSKAATVYISTGHFQAINSLVIADNIVGVGASSYLRFDSVQVFGGDTFVNMCDYGYGLFNLGYQGTTDGGLVAFAGGLSTFFPCENAVNYDLRRGRKVSDYGMQDNTYGVSYNGAGGKTGLEEYAYNDAYSSDGTMFAYPAMPVNFKNAGRFPFRIRFAGQKYPGELVDSFRVFLTNDYKDVDGGLGEINNLKTKEGKTYYWQNHGVGYVPILERQTVSATAGEATTLGTGGVVDRFDTISGVYGNQHQGSLTETKDGFIWFDMRNKGVLVMSSGGGVEEISVPTGMKSFFNEVFVERKSLYYSGTYLNSPTYDASSDRPLMGIGIISVYDPKTETSYMTFKFKEWTQKLSNVAAAESYTDYQVISKDFTVGFNHQINKFVGFYDKYPAIWHNHNQVVLSANNPKNINIYYAADMVVPTPVTIGDVIAVGSNEYICHTSGSITVYSATPDVSLFEALNQTNYIFAENEEKAYTVDIEGYKYNSFYNRIVNNEVEYVVNPKTDWPFSADTQLLIGNEVPFTSYYFENETQSASDVNVKSWKRDYELTDSGWFNNVPFGRKGKLTGMYIKAKYVKTNWTANPKTLSNSVVKILQKVKSYIGLKF